MSSSSTAESSSQFQGLREAILAYVAWGFFPIYWNLVPTLSVFEVFGHRVAWSFCFYLGLVAWKGRTREFLSLIEQPRRFWRLVLASLLIGTNWGIYIYAVKSHQVMESSLGYFINPLFTVALGRYALGEPLSLARRWALALATAGVAVIAWRLGHVPLIALLLAASFSLYGLVKKGFREDVTSLGAIESMVLLPLGIALAVIGRWTATQPLDIVDGAFLVASGVVTGMPLLWFSRAAQLLPLSMLGLLQYLAPTLQFLCAVFFFHEPISLLHLSGFALIWLALLVVSFEVWRARKVRI